MTTDERRCRRLKRGVAGTSFATSTSYGSSRKQPANSVRSVGIFDVLRSDARGPAVLSRFFSSRKKRLQDATPSSRRDDQPIAEEWQVFTYVTVAFRNHQIGLNDHLLFEPAQLSTTRPQDAPKADRVLSILLKSINAQIVMITY